MLPRLSRTRRKQRRIRRTVFESLEQRLMLAANWQNACNSSDVSGDGIVVPMDVLLLINEINANGSRALDTPSGQHVPPPYYDVNGEDECTPQDALIMINELNRSGGQ